jgi:hypothetical protein
MAPIARLALVAVIAVVAASCGGDDDGDGATPAGDAIVWVARSGEEALVRLDAQGRERGRVDLCCEPRDFVVNDGSVWVSTDTGTVMQVDEATDTVVATVEVGESAGAIGASGADVWVAADTMDIVEISAASGEITNRTTVGTIDAPVVDVEVDDESVWAVLDFAFAIVRVDRDSGEIAGQVSLCGAGECRVGAAASIAGRATGTVWVVDDTADELLAVSTTDLEIRGRTSLPDGRWTLVAGTDSTVAVDTSGGRLLRVVDEEAPTVEPVDVDFEGPVIAAMGAGSVWVYDAGATTLHRLRADTLAQQATTELDRIKLLAVS